MTEKDIEAPTSQPAETVSEPPALSAKPFEAETLYALLVAEFAGNRERYDIALGNYVQQAHQTRDAAVAARATRIARYLNARQIALDTALLWSDIDPNNREAQFIAAAELIQAGRLQEASRFSAMLLGHGQNSLFQNIAANATDATDIQREQLVNDFQAQLIAHPKNPDLFIGLGLLKQQQKQLPEALKFAKSALNIDPDSIPAAVLEAKLLGQLGNAQDAIQRLASMVEQNPDNLRLRLQYARLLASSDLTQSQEQFERMVADHPDDPELRFSLALISMEKDEFDQAKTHFQTLLEFPERQSSAHYYLGRIAQKQHQLEEALKHYIEVEPGPDFLPAMLQTTDILVTNGRKELAHQRLNSARERFPNQAERFYLLEAEVLSTHGHLQEALAVLTHGLEQSPSNVRLLYSRAMVNEQLDALSDLEADLRTILKYEPNNATALNALGYTLANRTDRFDEALALIDQALQLKPDDPAIMDSMGWVQYRLGNLDDAILRLREAMKAFPDHEVAAHLGEVLWVSGDKEEAEQVWNRGLRLNPDSTIIPAVMERLKQTP